MATYSYVVAKFVPDIVKNEPINVGVMVQTNDSVEGKFLENYRSLAMRYRDVNTKALQRIFEGFKGKHTVTSGDYIKKMSDDYHYQLLFSPPAAIVAGTPQHALDKLYDMFISVEPQKRERKTLTRVELQSLVRKEIHDRLKKEWVVRKYPIKGPKDHFAFDFAFKNGKVSDLLHAISFEGNAKSALMMAKALALTVEYVMRENDDVSCAALVHPPKDEEKEKEFYEPAIGYLKDQECIIRTEHQIPQYVLQIEQKLKKRAH